MNKRPLIRKQTINKLANKKLFLNEFSIFDVVDSICCFVKETSDIRNIWTSDAGKERSNERNDWKTEEMMSKGKFQRNSHSFERAILIEV